MCGRFAMACNLSDITEAFEIQEITCEQKPNYNIAPGTKVATVIYNETNRLVPLKWGLVPAWSKDPSIGNRLINARAETVKEKPSFKNAFKQRRCLIAATGFYEWRKDIHGTTPFYIGLRTDEPFGFAGLYEIWQSPDGNELNTCTVITTQANELIKPIHDRMPVIIQHHEHTQWLDPSIRDTQALLSLLKPYPPEKMKVHRVSTLVNSPLNNSADCIKPIPNNDTHGSPGNTAE